MKEETEAQKISYFVSQTFHVHEYSNGEKTSLNWFLAVAHLTVKDASS